MEMKKYRAIWFLWIFGITAVYIFSGNSGAFVMLVASVLAAVVSSVLNVFVTNKISVEVDFDGNAEKGGTVKGTVKLKNRGILPVNTAVFTASCKNILTGEEHIVSFYFSMGIRGVEVLPFEVKGERCGKIFFKIDAVKVYDIFGLTYKKCKREKLTDANAETYILPDIYDTSIGEDLAEDPDIEGISYSDRCSGFDLSEPLGIRDYRYGDSVRSIHWKLTNKLDRIVVREPGLPVENSALMLFETSVPENGKAPEAEVCSALAEAFISVGKSLLDAGISYCAGWKASDPDCEEFKVYSVSAEDDLLGVMDGILASGFRKNDDSAVLSFFKAYGDFGFSHIIYVSPYIPPEDEIKLLDGEVTVLLCTRDFSGVIPDREKVSVISFAPETAERDLSFGRK